MTDNPQVQHGEQPAVNPRVVTGGPLGETLVREGGEPVQAPPEEPQAPPEAPEEPEPDLADPATD